jgi:Icc-related predicted phosphoesterase
MHWLGPHPKVFNDETSHHLEDLSLPMRIIAVADTHLYHQDLGALPPGDVLVHAGDLLRGGTLDELAQGAQWLNAQDFAHTILVAGNHDRCFESQRQEAAAMLGPRVTYLQDSATEIMGLKFWGSPWQPAYHNWAFNLPRGDALKAYWSRIPEDIDVLITHGPPAGMGDRSPVPGRGGCVQLMERVQQVQPALHLFGHIHQDGGFWQPEHTAFANVTTWECERAVTIIDIDPQTRSVQAVQVPAAM